MPESIKNCDVQFAYQCPKEWSQLQSTSCADTRFCQTCKKEVYLCYTQQQLAERVSFRHCVAFDVAEFTLTSSESITKLKKGNAQKYISRQRVMGVMIDYDQSGADSQEDGASSPLHNLITAAEQELKQLKKSENDTA